MIHFDRPYCTIRHISDISAVHLDWNMEATHDQFVEACDFSLRLMIKMKVKKMIADNSKINAVSEENQNWLTEDWFPRALENGFQYSAVILSNNDSVQSALKLIVSRVNTKHIIVRYFSEVSMAKDWLSKVE